MKSVTVCIPVRKDGSPNKMTLQSLAHQTDCDFDVVIAWDNELRGANWARNRALEKARTEFVLFSDDDIEWRPDALAVLKSTLISHPEAAYAYGMYEMEGRVYCHQPFDPKTLVRHNYISTMSMVRRDQFCGFDESIPRLQDWAAWLHMLAQGKVGINSNQIIFRTAVRMGITYGGTVSYAEAERIVLEKYL